MRQSNLTSSKGEENLVFQIRSFPTQKSGHRYPVAYLDGHQTKVISIPIGSSHCSPNCYSHNEYYKFNDSISSRKCPVCRERNQDRKYFIDIGLMMFIQKNQALIVTNKYGWACIDGDGRLICWEPLVNPLLDALSKYSTKQIIQKCVNQVQIQQINYIMMRSIVREKFIALYNVFREKSNNKLLTWCRANLRVDEHFDGLILNTSAKPNGFVFYRFVDEIGSGLSFEGKQTHVDYISAQNIFIIMVTSETNKEHLLLYVADLTQGMMDNNKLVIQPINFNKFKWRKWFSTCYDKEDNSLYLHGGEYPNKLPGKVERLYNIKWDGKNLYCDYEECHTLIVACSLCAMSMATIGDTKSLMVGGGISIKDRTVRQQLETILWSYKNPPHKQQSKPLGGKFAGVFGAFCNMIEIPAIQGANIKEGLLIFGGNSDFRTDVDRQDFCKVYLWRHKDPMVELTKKCSNHNYPFLFESTGIVLKTNGNQYVIRALVPARNSANKATKAYLLEFNMNTNVLEETVLNGTHIK